MGLSSPFVTSYPKRLTDTLFNKPPVQPVSIKHNAINNLRAMTLFTLHIKTVQMKELSNIIEKIRVSEDLDFEDGMILMESKNLQLTGALADYVRRRAV